MSSSTRSGTKVSAASHRRQAVVGRRTVRQPSSSSIIARLLALSTLSSTTSTRGAGVRQGAAGGAGAPRRCRQAAASVGRRTVKRAAAVLALALGLDACRRASRPAASPASGRCRGRPARARGCGRPARTCRTRAAACSAGMPMPVSLHGHHRLARLAPGAEHDPAALGRVLGGVVEQVGEHLRQPGRIGVARSAARPAAGAASARGRRASISGRLVSTAFCSTVSRSTRSGRSSILPRVMRRRRAGRRPAAPSA